MAYITIVAVIEIAEESTSNDPDERIAVGMDLFKNPDKVRFIMAERDVTATAVIRGAGALFADSEGTLSGEF